MAVERYQQYLGLRPKDAEAHYTLGLVFKELGRTELAIERFNQSITVVADNAAVHRQLGDAYTKLQRLEEAIKPYQTALAIDASDVATIIIRAQTQRLLKALHGLLRLPHSLIRSP